MKASYCVAIAIGITFCAYLPCHGAAPTRAQEDAIAAQRPALDKLMLDVVGNCHAIESMYLKPGHFEREMILQRLREVKNVLGCGDHEAATSDFLCARTYYWSGFHEFKATRQRNIFDQLRVPAAEAYLSAWKGIQGKDADGAGDPLRIDVARSFVSFLGTNIWGKSLPADVKPRIVAGFVDPLEKETGLDRFVSWEDRVKMYQSLGVDSRLRESLPQLPTEYEELLGLLKNKANVLSREAKAQVVAVLAERYKERIQKDASTCALIGNVFEEAGNYANAQRYLLRAAALQKEYYLPLYRLSLQAGAGISPKTTESYADGYLVGASQGGTGQSGSGYTRSHAYRRLVESLWQVGRVEAALGYVDGYEKDTQCDHAAATDLTMLRWRGRCLDSLGRRSECIRAYQAYLAKAIDMRGYEHAIEIVKRRLAVLTNANGG